MRTVRISTRIAALAAAGATIAFATAVATPASASSGRPQATARGPVWHQVTSNGLEDFADIGLAPGARGAVNVIWTTGGNTGGHAKILDTPVSFAGAVGHTATIAAGGFIYTDPDATFSSTRIYAVWNGDKTSSGPEGTFIASRAIAGGAWSAAANYPPNPPGIPDTSSADTATMGSDGKPWVAFNGTDAMTVLHVGQTERQIGPTNACCLYDAGLAVDGHSHATWLGYQSLITRHEGVFLQGLSQNGKAAGRPQLLPGSTVKGGTLVRNQRIAITGRGHGRPGVYVAYVAGWPFGLSVDLLKAGSHKAVKIAGTSSARQFAGVAMSANSGGGLWLAWYNGDGVAAGLTVAESNNAVTRFGKAHRVALPAGTSVILKEYITAVGSRLDILALLTRHGKTAYWFTQVR